LDHPWSGNVVDLCPVGSLISKDFLHKARAWDLDKTASICTGCTQGCNVMIDTRDDVVVRIRPRPNLDVNRHFICDAGRADYRWMNRGDRVETPMRAIAGGGQAIEWEGAIAEFAELLRRDQGRVVLLLGGRVSSEAIGWLLKLVEGRDHVAAMKVPLGDEAPLTGIPGLALRAERAANLHGARMLGASASWDQAITALDGASVAIVVGAELDDVE